MVPACSTLSRVAESVSYLANKTSTFLDVRLGAITYTVVRGRAFSSISHLTPLDRLSKEETPGFLPISQDYITAALRDSLNMDWRNDAAKILIFAPLAEPLGSTESYYDSGISLPDKLLHSHPTSEYQINELINQLKERSILLVSVRLPESANIQLCRL